MKILIKLCLVGGMFSVVIVLLIYSLKQANLKLEMQPKYKQLYIITKNELEETQNSLDSVRIENDTLTVRLHNCVNTDLDGTKKRLGL